jgi:hypothetical protein
MKINFLILVLITFGFGLTKQSSSAFAADDFEVTFKNSKNEVIRLRKETDSLEDRVKQVEASGLYSPTQLKKMSDQGDGIYGKLKAKRQEFKAAYDKHVQLQPQVDMTASTLSLLLVSDFDMAIVDNRSVDQKLQNLRRLYDQSNLGAYLKDKMLQFANTKQVCEIAESCKDPKKRAAKVNSIKEVFSGDKSDVSGTAPAAGQR